LSAPAPRRAQLTFTASNRRRKRERRRARARDDSMDPLDAQFDEMRAALIEKLA
jgi:hypothetical protein